MAEYSVYLCDPFGTKLADASSFISLQYTRVVNAISSLRLVLPSNFDTRLVRIPDGRIEVWRRVPNGQEYLDTETTWLIKALEYKRDDDGLVSIHVEADTPLCILKSPGRIVDYYAESNQSSKVDIEADDLIKAIVRENAGSLATDTSRDLSPYLSIAPDHGLGPLISKAFAWRAVLNVLRDIANASAESGTYLAFDIVAPTPSTFEFRTYTQQRGIDHRFPAGQNPVIIGPEFGNMGQASLRYDWRDEVTSATAGGQGQGTNRQVERAWDDLRLYASPFGLREVFVQATQTADTVALTNEARSAVREGRPRKILQGKLLDTPDTRYGVHWAWGDFVTIQAFGQQVDCRVDAISVSIERGKETIEAWLRSDVIAEADGGGGE